MGTGVWGCVRLAWPTKVSVGGRALLTEAFKDRVLEGASLATKPHVPAAPVLETPIHLRFLKENHPEGYIG